MSTTVPVHACPPPGHGLTPCCGRPPSEVAAHRITTDPAQVTCRERQIAELPVDSDRGESPFGWSELPADQRADRLEQALRAVRRQCADWARPTSAVTWDSRVRDRAIALAAQIVVETIDQLVPGLGDEDPEQAAIKPQLLDRITAVLLMTPRGDAGDLRPHGPHGEGGHTYDSRCALCTGDTDALAEALLHAFTATVLSPEPGPRLARLT